MQLGARGTSVLVASGDGGVGGSRPNNTCTTFIPTFPASCPWVTAVGATQGYPKESGADLSSGGFSNYFDQPNYQSFAVSGYLSQIGGLYSGRFNPGGRAYPDVGAEGTNIGIFIGGEGALVEGTSASAPIFSSVIALINDRSISFYQQRLGFLNPLLYLRPEVFNDITSGSNPSCGTTGFPAKLGWDPVTGLGTPNFPLLADSFGV